MSITPDKVAPGETGFINLTIANTGNQYVKDIIVNFNLPAEIAPYNDLTTNKIAQLDSVAQLLMPLRDKF